MKTLQKKYRVTYRYITKGYVDVTAPSVREARKLIDSSQYGDNEEVTSFKTTRVFRVKKEKELHEVLDIIDEQNANEVIEENTPTVEELEKECGH